MQSWNWPAIRKCAQLIRTPRILIPKLSVNHLSDIDWIKLRDEFNIRAICFDKDNTITAPYCQNLHFSVLKSIEECKAIFGDRIAVFSNSIGSNHFDKNFKLADKFTKNTGLQVILHHSKKPEGSDCIKNYFNNLDSDLKSDQIALIGDRILTDVVMANEAGFFSIYLVEPLTIQGDNLPAIVFRYLERKLLYLINNK